jgi:hypothetical protein
MLVDTGRAHALDATHVWVDNPTEAVELFRLAYQRAQVAARVRATPDQVGSAVSSSASRVSASTRSRDPETFVSERS